MLLLAALGLLAGSILLYVLVPDLLLYWRYPWPVYGTLAAAAAVAAWSGARRWLRWPVIVLTSAVLALFVLYTTSFSHLPTHALKVAPGDPFPEFTLPTSRAEPFSPSSLRGRSAALFVFYRGDW